MVKGWIVWILRCEYARFNEVPMLKGSRLLDAERYQNNWNQCESSFIDYNGTPFGWHCCLSSDSIQFASVKIEVCWIDDHRPKDAEMEIQRIIGGENNKLNAEPRSR